MTTATKDPLKACKEGQQIAGHLLSFITETKDVSADGLLAGMDLTKSILKNIKMEDSEKTLVTSCLVFMESTGKDTYMDMKSLATPARTPVRGFNDRFYVSDVGAVKGDSGTTYLTLTTYSIGKVQGVCDAYGMCDEVPQFVTNNPKDKNKTGPWPIVLSQIAVHSWKGEIIVEDGLKCGVLHMRDKDDTIIVDDKDIKKIEQIESEKRGEIPARQQEFFRRTKLQPSTQGCKDALEAVLRMSKDEWEKWKEHHPRHTTGTGKEVITTGK